MKSTYHSVFKNLSKITFLTKITSLLEDFIFSLPHTWRYISYVQSLNNVLPASKELTRKDPNYITDLSALGTFG